MFQHLLSYCKEDNFVSLTEKIFEVFFNASLDPNLQSITVIAYCQVANNNLSTMSSNEENGWYYEIVFLFFLITRLDFYQLTTYKLV